MKKRITAFALTLVLIIGTFSTGVMAATQTEVDTEVTSTATYLAGALSGKLVLNDYHKVFLVAASNIDATALLNEYLVLVKATPSTSFSLEQYGGSIMALRAGGIDPTNIDGRNLVAEFSTALNAPANATFFSTFSSNSSNSPHTISYMLSSMICYKDSITNSAALITAAKDTILDYYDGTNHYFDYWGGNADNDGKLIVGLKSFYDQSDSEIVTITGTAITSIKSTLDSNHQSVGCGVPSVYPDPYFMGAINSSSTGISLFALATYGDSEANNIYTGLLGFKVAGTPGAYHSAYSALPDPGYSTPDALEGLLAYSRMLSGGTSIYNLSSYSLATPVVVAQNVTQNVSPKTADATPFIFIAVMIFAAGVFTLTLRKKLTTR